jgi:hypothetical protein
MHADERNPPKASTAVAQPRPDAFLIRQKSRLRGITLGSISVESRIDFEVMNRAICLASSTTPSISNAISSRARRSGSSEPRRQTKGEMRLPQCDRVFRSRLLLLDRLI